MRQRTFSFFPQLPFVLALILIFFPIAFYFYFISAYGLKTPFFDDWEIVSLMGHFYAGNLKFAHLWAQHNENRMLIPNLIFIALYRLTAFNVKAAMMSSGILVTLSFFSLSIIFIRRHGPRIWPLIPLAYLLFNLSDTENILWGFQMAWQLVFFCFLGAIACLEESGKNQMAFAAAILLAILASFSSLQGLFIWPAGFIYLLFNDFSPRQKKIWILTALICGIIYFTGFNFHSTGGPTILYGLSHPLNFLEYLLTFLGGILVFPLKHNGKNFFAARDFVGLSLLIAGVPSLFQALTRSKKDKAFLAPAAIGIFALLFCLAASIGRAGFGPGQALSPRYAICGLFFLISIYLTLLEMMKVDEKKFALPFRAFLFICLIQIIASLDWGLSTGKNYLSRDTIGQEVLMNYRVVSPALIATYLYPYPQKIPARAFILEKYRLNVFSNWKAHTLLPAPESLKRLFQKRPTDWLIWKLISTIYLYRPDLQKKYPPIPSDKKFAREISSWASRRGTTDDPDRILLIPWKDQILQINLAIKRDRDSPHLLD